MGARCSSRRLALTLLRQTLRELGSLAGAATPIQGGDDISHLRHQLREVDASMSVSFDTKDDSLPTCRLVSEV